MTPEDAARRLAAAHPSLSAEILADKLGHLAAPAPGGLAWRRDPLHKSTSPVPFFAEVFGAFAARVSCPVLFVSGGASGYHPPDEAERLATFSRLTKVEVDGAGHMVHWTEPGALVDALARFLSVVP